ncbi:hypothetical protein C5167_007047 [Papaver somniferum]|uniref:PDZ domain-containing protein n=1 Tax=Papaver somniferum TaxID=3469 RepID=A0A4Y7JIY7_PAPSO|nr:putative protease Do-like 14 [Papaver somniferum]RZC59729.1 hypothetical protein C5167_007047 [Papaver somniferum]
MERQSKRLRIGPLTILQINRNNFWEKFDSFHEENRYLSDDVKLSVQKVCSSVVSIGSFAKKFKFLGTGTIIGCDKINDNRYVSSVLTSASLFGASNKNYNVTSNDEFKVEVYFDERTFQVHEFSYDGHYNIALLKFESTTSMLIASLKSVEVIRGAARERLLRRRSEVCRISANDQLIAVGRYFNEPFSLMAAPGAFSHGCCSLDCPPLLKTTCIISKCGTGGPLINGDGEIIGINFFAEGYTPFLPMNIILKCLEYFEKNGRFVRPSIGIRGANLCDATSLSTLEKISQKFPDVSKGILVKEVVPQSPAYHAGICAGDVLTSCGRNIIKSVVEFEATLFNRIGNSLEVQVLKQRGQFEEKIVVVGETSPDNFFSWPLPKERRVILKSSPRH